MTTIPSMLYFHRGWGRSSSKGATSPERRYPALLAARRYLQTPSPDIQPPSGIGRRTGILSELDMACTDSPISPSFLHVSEMFPRLEALQCHCPIRALPYTLELSADDADPCVARLADAPYTAAFVTTLTLRVVLALALALRSMPVLSALALPAFDAEQLAAAPGTLMHLTLLADMLSYAFFDEVLAAPACVRLTHLVLPHFVGVPPAAHVSYSFFFTFSGRFLCAYIFISNTFSILITT
ncbi:hypothetical protein EDB84DRAFT_1142156 [Lactarius hengduanensis]|nr:hypothetical protein EDB84DRAFT_1142156 [Lactarius hengduanensis]